jgi:hypothetical protein
MAIRRQTVALLFLLAGIALVGVLHHRPRVWVYEHLEPDTAPPDYYAPTAAQSAATFARLTAPKGFSRRLAGCWKNEACFHSPASMLLSVALVDRWATEAGLTVDHENSAVRCLRDFRARPGRITLMGCGGMSATRGKAEIDVFSHSLVLAGRHGLRPTNARVNKLQGTELFLIDLGVPNVKEIHKEEAEAAKETG